jgi:hypothetical protein
MDRTFFKSSPEPKVKLKDGDKIKLYSQVDVDGKHITVNFNPESQASGGPAMLEGAKDGDTVKVVKYGEYKDNDMEYDVVYVEVNGEKHYAQASGTPFHITRYTNAENGIKPFMTGKHAATQEFDRSKRMDTYEGKLSYAYGTYNSKFDKSSTEPIVSPIKTNRVQGVVNIETDTITDKKLMAETVKSLKTCKI